MTRTITPGSPEWPVLLKEMHPLDPPDRLHVTGQRLVGDARCVAIVGTRRPSLAGLETARALAGSLARRGFVIVSGLALGIDAAAHRAALDASGTTVAVLGCGVDIAYPRANQRLFDCIAERGALVSEYADGTPPEKWRFPRRNRLIAGMCEAVVVVEGAIRSGALITARLALDANRSVFAVPGSPLNVRATGANELIRTSQAALVLTAEHVLEELAPELAGIGASGAPRPVPRLDEAQRAVLLLFDGAPLSLQTLAAKASRTGEDDQPRLDPGRIALTLAGLEVRGLVARRFGAYELTATGAAAVEGLVGGRGQQREGGGQTGTGGTGGTGGR